MEAYKIDSLDRRILRYLSENARIPFIEIARKCKVSNAAIHQRITKLEEAKVIRSYHAAINPTALGYTTLAFVGLQINLVSEFTHNAVFRRIKDVPEVIECHHVTGKYSLFIKIYSKGNEHLKNILVEKIQSIPEVISTETIISLQIGFDRELVVEK